MSALNISGSLNVAVLDSKIICDLCAGKFFVDVTPSTFIGTGANNIKGVKIQIINPYNVIVKDYSSVYDIPAPATSVYGFNIPTQAGSYQYGQYLISVQLTDADNTVYELTKPVSPCEVDRTNKSSNSGKISATIEGICKEAKVKVRIDTPPAYKGILSQTQVNNFKIEYPTISGLPVKANVTVGVFSLKLFEGGYRVSGSVCATYNDTDNVSYKVNYLLDKIKDIRCTIDECCIFQKLTELHQKIESNCSEKEKEDTASLTLDVLRLLTTARLAADCGEDASDYVLELENLLQCRCSATDGAIALTDIQPTKDFVIEGCNVQKNAIGLTDYYTIDIYDYVVSVAENGGVITASAPTISDCKKEVVLSFDVSKLYNQIKNQANSSNAETLFWASIINKSLIGLNPQCLGVTQQDWDAFTFADKFNKLLTKMCACCSCDAAVTIVSIEKVGADVKVVWQNSTDSVSVVNVYLDGILIGTVLGSVTSFTFMGAADGITHGITLEPLCAGNTVGTVISSQFTLSGCPTIQTPSVSQGNVANAVCPFDLNTIVTAAPTGFTNEWHNANNTLPSSLVGNPSQVSDGVYFVFAKDTNGCYSSGAQVTLTCHAVTSCTAPQNVILQQQGTFGLGFPGYFLRFQSAAFPPPNNSYTVKRRLYADPDVSASYTTIGTPTFNTTLNVWQSEDPNILLDNTRYLYRAISNCPDTTPYADYIFVRFGCPVLTIIPTTNSISFSFDKVAGEVNKYVVDLLNSSGTSIVQTKTYLPAFPNTISDVFTGLNPSSNYKVRVTEYIDTLYQVCSPIDVSTEEVSSENPCVDLSISGYGSNAGAFTQYGLRADLDQAYDQDIIVTGYIYGDRYPQTLFSITIPAGETTFETGYIYNFDAGESLFGQIVKIEPLVVTAGGNSYDTQCNVDAAF